MIPRSRFLPVNLSSVKLSCLCKTNTWSRLSRHAPPSAPTTHLSGSLSQNGSTSYFGTAPCARAPCGQKIADAHANTTHVAVMMKSFVFRFIFDLILP